MKIGSITRRIRKSAVFQEIAGYVCNPLEPKQWIFVVGCYNSGTSLLSGLLAAHPDCSGASNEGVALTNQLARPEQYGWPRMWTKCHKQMLVPEASDMALKTAVLIKRQWGPSFDRQASCIVEKSITNALRIDFLSKYFAPAKFVYITRDGLAVAEGIRRKARPAKYSNPEGLQQYPIELCLEQWVAANQEIQSSLKKLNEPSDAFSISYEELCASPHDVLTNLFRGLGLSSDFLETDQTMIEKISRISNFNKRSYDSFNSGEVESLRRAYKEELEYLGYG